MINQILFPTDFSDVANNALEFAIDIAKKTGAKLHVLHVNPLPVMDINFPQETYQLYLSELTDAAARDLEALANIHLKNSGLKYELHTRIGFVNDEVLSTANTIQADLIIMGTTGASGFQELLVGSNTAAVVGRSPIPVFVIPPSSKHGDFKHILYVSDYSEPEFPAVSRLIYFAELYGAPITVLHAKSDADRYFKSEDNFFVKNKGKLSGAKITLAPAEQGDFAHAIDAFIDKSGVDMVVMAKHNRSWFDRIFHRSLSKRMTYHTRVPLLVLNK